MANKDRRLLLCDTTLVPPQYSSLPSLASTRPCQLYAQLAKPYFYLVGSTITTTSRIPPACVNGPVTVTPQMTKMTTLRKHIDEQDILHRTIGDPIQKRGTAKLMSKFANCMLSTLRASPLTEPAYPFVYEELLQIEYNGRMSSRFTTISRYDRVTTVSQGDCQSYYFTTTRLNAAEFKNGNPWQDYMNGAEADNNNISLDHACQ